MRCVTVQTVVLALLGVLVILQVGVVWGQFLNKRPFPTYSLERMPDTGFTCRDKVLGGYYADSETQCQMFHICVKVSGLGVQDFRFLCPNGTAFDQDSQICAEWDDVDCEAATLYYSSDNFDLYRVGSGYETAAYTGEDEATFHLQRSETGDARLIREHQSQRINQQTDFNTAVPPRRLSPSPQRAERERDILRASQSGNFFNNRNGGKETEDDYYQDDRQPNLNNDIPKKKVIRKFNQRKEDNFEQQAQTQRPQRPTAFVNNFAGSIRPSGSSTQKPSTVGQYQEEPRRQSGRTRGGEKQYNNAETFRNNEYNNRNQYTVSTPAPFKAPENYNNNNQKQYKTTNRQTTHNQYNNQYDNGQYSSTTAKPYNQYNDQRSTQPIRQNYNNNQYQQQQQQPQQQPKQSDNYPSTPVVSNKQIFQSKQTENYPTTSVKQQTFNNNYPSTPAAQNYNPYQNKQTENYPSTVAKPKQIDIFPSTVSPFQQKTTQYKKETENYPTTSFINNQNYNKYDVPKKTTQYKQTENYPTTFAPSKQTFLKQTTQYYQPKETDNFPQNNKQSTQQYNNQFDNTRSQYQSSQQHPTTNRPTTQHTQYTPTVPKQTTQFYSTTSTPRFSKQFDETSYDDGSYNPKYDDEKYKPEEEFLKTAHSQNFASARNELISSTKTGSTVTTQSPRPFSVTTPLPRITNSPRATSPAKQTQTVPKTTQFVEKETKNVKTETKKNKPEKDVSYDYAYYDSNIGSEPDYDIGTEFAKSTKKSE